MLFRPERVTHKYGEKDRPRAWCLTPHSLFLALPVRGPSGLGEQQGTHFPMATRGSHHALCCGRSAGDSRSVVPKTSTTYLPLRFPPSLPPFPLPPPLCSTSRTHLPRSRPRAYTWCPVPAPPPPPPAPAPLDADEADAASPRTRLVSRVKAARSTVAHEPVRRKSCRSSMATHSKRWPVYFLSSWRKGPGGGRGGEGREGEGRGGEGRGVWRAA